MVEVAGGVGGRDVGQEPAADLAAAPRQVGGLARIALRGGARWWGSTTPAQKLASLRLLRKQCTRVLALVPRGSQLTTSKRPPPHGVERLPDRPAPERRRCRPGPPGLMNIVPIRCSGLLARWRITARLIVRPFGRPSRAAPGSGALQPSVQSTSIAIRAPPNFNCASLSCRPMGAAELLWRPSAERIERATLTRFGAGSRRSAACSSTATRRCGDGRSMTSTRSGGVGRVLRRALLRAARRPVLGARSMPGAQWFPGARCQLRRAHVPRQARRGHRDPARVGVARAGRVDVGRAARGDGGDRGGPARARRRARATGSPPTCRTSPRRWRRCSRAPRSARCGPRRRPSSAPGA